MIDPDYALEFDTACGDCVKIEYQPRIEDEEVVIKVGGGIATMPWDEWTAFVVRFETLASFADDGRELE